MKIANILPVTLLLLILVASSAVAQKTKPQKQKPPATKNNTTTKPKPTVVKPAPAPPHDQTEDEKKVRDMVAFLEYMLNTLGGTTASARDKDILVTESFIKVFRDNKVQIEDDLDDERQVITNKGVTAYLKDVDFFYKDVKLEFAIEKIEKGESATNKLFYKVTLQRNLSGTTSAGKTVNNAVQRFIEINYDTQEQDLKIASIYTHEIDQRETVMNWWKQLSFEWQTIFREKLAGKGPSRNAADSLSYEDIQIILSLDSLDIRNNHYVRNIDPLARLVNLTSLNLSGTSVEDISAVRNLTELVNLDISNTKIVDLNGLRYSPKLTGLNLRYTPITDLSIIQKLPLLKQLNVSFTTVSDLAPLGDAVQLTQLNVSHTTVTDLTPLQGLTRIVSLTVSGTPVNDLIALKALKLEVLNIDSTKVSNLDALGGQTNLVALFANNTKITDLTPLQKLPNLTRIYCDKTGVNRVIADAFTTANPKVLVVFDTQDLTTWWNTLSDDWHELLSASAKVLANPDKDALAAITNLDSLNLKGKHIDELEPVRKLPKLRSLVAAGTGISDLSPLKDSRQLEYLDVSETEVSDISIVENLTKLKTFRADKSKVQSIYSLYALPGLKSVYVDQTAIHDITAREFLDKNPKCLLVYKTIHLNRWWSKLSENWRTVFRAQMTGDTTAARENLHRLVEQEALHFKDAPVSDLADLVEFMRLTELHFSSTSITDLTPLANHRWLKSLHATSGPIQNITIISQLMELSDVDISNTPIDDLKPLTNLSRLKTLNCAGTQIRKLDPLAPLVALESLDCSNTLVRNLDPVSMRTLKVLKCYNSKVSAREIEAFKRQNPDCDVVYYR